MDESTRVDQLKSDGAMALYEICGQFVARLNECLAEPAVMLAPFEWEPGNFEDNQTNFFQISLRGRLLQLEFRSTEETYSTEDFRRPYILHGTARSFNQASLERNRMGEQRLFCCPAGESVQWFFFDARTYRTGHVNRDYLAAELERLL